MDILAELLALKGMLFSTRKKAKDNAQDISELSAQGAIKGFEVLTQAAYDALVSADTVDPKIVYMISG